MRAPAGDECPAGARPAAFAGRSPSGLADRAAAESSGCGQANKSIQTCYVCILFRNSGRLQPFAGMANRRSPDAERRFTSGGPKSDAKIRVARLAARQVGRVRYDQVRALGTGHATISAWRQSGFLHWELPRVYAVGHPGRSVESDLAAAVLYAGPGAMLSHGTAIWWLDLLKYPPPEIHVSTPRRIQSIGHIIVHDRRRIRRAWRKGLPVTTPSRAILDFAATGPHDLLRLVLANADYHDLLDVHELQKLTGRGVDGSAALNDALRIHLPQLAYTRSDNEILLLTFCESQHVPIPEMNVYLHGFLVDALWRKQHLVVEIDGHRGHRTPAQLYDNHRRDLALRAKRFVVLRYARRQFIETPAAVAEDVLFHLAREL
jgi:hypothetical protein